MYIKFKYLNDNVRPANDGIAPSPYGEGWGEEKKNSLSRKKDRLLLYN
jgi:hypothetical protein